VVAIVDAENPQIKQLLDRITAENFKVEVSDPATFQKHN
jgi:hypothetical protein